MTSKVALPEMTAAPERYLVLVLVFPQVSESPTEIFTMNYHSDWKTNLQNEQSILQFV
jgi:hypothetical protein